MKTCNHLKELEEYLFSLNIIYLMKKGFEETRLDIVFILIVY